MKTWTLVLMCCLVGCSRESAPSNTPTQSESSPDEAPLSEIPVGGSCDYDSFAGTCTVEADQSVSFEATIDGQPVVLKGNPIEYPSSELANRPTGTRAACSLQFITKGTCTPCMLSVASCGEEAWEYFRKQGR